MCIRDRTLQAIDDYTEAIRWNPKHLDAYNNRAASYIELRQPDQAIPDLEQALSIDGNSASAYALRSMANTLLGYDDQAKKDSDHAVLLGFDGCALEYLVMRAKQQRIPDIGGNRAQN